MVVRTSNSTYTVDTCKKLISGGSIAKIFGRETVEYAYVGPAMVGGTLVVVTKDGISFRTSTIIAARA